MNKLWEQFVKEANNKNRYYWFSRGPVKEGLIEFGKTNVPQTQPRNKKMEELFEKVRREVNSTAPSRLNCVYLCETIGGDSFCSKGDLNSNSEAFIVELRGDYTLFKTNSEFWTEAVFASDREVSLYWAKQYWQPEQSDYGMAEILISPPESAIIVGRL